MKLLKQETENELMIEMILHSKRYSLTLDKIRCTGCGICTQRCPIEAKDEYNKGLKRRKAILMSLCTAERLPEIRQVVAQPPTQQQQMLSGYLRQQISRGVVRDLPSPELAAKLFFGMLFEFAISQPLITGTPIAHVLPEGVVAQVVDIFVRGTIENNTEEK